MTVGDNDFVIRPIEVSDNKAMAAIIRKVMTGFGCEGPGFAMQDPEVDTMAESYKLAGHRYFVLTHNHTVLGGAGIAPLSGGEPGVCELRKMYFLDSVRGKGLGRRMGERCLKTAREMGYQECYLETLEFMTDARRLYERLGFQRLEKACGDTGHFGCDYFYSVDLGSSEAP